MLVATRHENWKTVFCEQRAQGHFDLWQEPFTCLSIPKIFNLRMDPYERANITGDGYNNWVVHNAYLNVVGAIAAEEFIGTFKEYPPSQAPASFTLNPDAILDMLHHQRAAERPRLYGQAG